MQARYVLAADCGTTLTGTAGTGLCANSNTVSIVIFPTAPTISAPVNTCNAAFTLPTVTTVTGFTVQYSINNGTFAAAPTIPTTPGCYNVRAQYVLTAACGSTVANTAGTGSCGPSNTVNVVIFPTAPAAPTVTAGCGAFTVTPPATIAGFNIEYSFDDGATWGANTPPTAENCTGYKIKTRYVTSAACGTIPAGTASSIAACKESPATTRVVDNTAPVLTCPSSQTFCAVAGNTYTIPLLVASDNCTTTGSLTIAFAITGATTRSGTGTDASGTFNAGISTITWTVTDACSRVSTCATTVTINALPVLTAPAGVCIGSTATLSPTTGGTWISSNPAVATVTNAGVITGVSLGTVTFTFTNTSTGCSNTTTSVTVNPKPGPITITHN